MGTVVDECSPSRAASETLPRKMARAQGQTIMKLRPYQQAAVDAVFDFWDRGGGNPLIDLATGTGKSLVIAALTKRLVEECGARALMLTHVRELVSQNVAELLRAWPAAPVGINSAGLGRRDRRAQILFASIQSVARETAETLGERHVILVDEAHLIPRAGAGQYLTLIGKLREAVPDLRVIGLTATPYRLDSGRLDKGDGAMFDEVVYTYNIAQGVADGFLAPLSSRATGSVVDISKVPRRGGELVSGAQLESAVSSITQAACDEIVARGSDRRSWLIFCDSVANAEVVRDLMRARGVTCETVTGETPKAQRDSIFAAFKAGRIRALSGCQVFTTGFNAPGVDLIAMLRPTLSTSLYVQMLGRGTRLADGKSDCLVLDFAGNIMRHGPVDAVTVKGGPSSGGDGKVAVDSVLAKACPTCETLVSTRVYTCPYCGHEWEKPQEPKHAAQADRDAAVMSREIVNRWLPVRSAHARTHVKGERVSLRIDYEVGMKVYSEWVTLEHDGRAGTWAQKWWRVIMAEQAPQWVSEAVDAFKSDRIIAIQIARDGEYWRVVAWRVKRPDGRIVEIDSKLNTRPAALQEIARAS
jgi:DNA repair protein RadD